MSKKATNKGFSYDAYLKSQTENKNRGLVIPERIVCDRCKKLKGRMNYSNKRLMDLEDRMRLGKSKTVTCSSCLGGQVQELECCMCQTWHGLEEFAKAQRKNPDGAKCNKCMMRQLEAETPEDIQNVSEINEDDDNAFTQNPTKTPAKTPNKTGTSSPFVSQELEETFVRPSNMGTLIAGLDNVSVSDDNASVATGMTHTFNTWQTIDQQNQLQAPLTPTVAKHAFNPKAYGHPGATSSPARPMGGPVGSAARSVSASSRLKEDEAIRPAGGWAKVKAYKPKVILDNEDEQTKSYASRDDDSDDSEEVEI